MQIGLVVLSGQCECGRYLARVERSGLQDQTIPTSFKPRFLTRASTLAPATFIRSPRLKTPLMPRRWGPKTPATFEQLREVCEVDKGRPPRQKAEFDKIFGGPDELEESE